MSREAPEALPPEAAPEAFPPGAAAREGAVLATIAVGPAVIGPRTALAAIVRHGAEPHLSAGPAPLERVAWGAGQVLWAARLLRRDRALRRAAAVPTLLTGLGCAGLAALFTFGKGRGTAALGPASALHAYMTAFVALASMPPTLLQRQWARVAREARRALGLPLGRDPFAGRAWLRVVIAEWIKALRQAAVVAVGIAPLLVALHVLPDGVHAPAVIAALWAFYWVVVDAFELPMEVAPVAGAASAGPEPWFARLLGRVGRSARLLRVVGWAGRQGGRLAQPWREELHFTERHRWESAGMGIAAGALLSIPVLGLAFRAVAIVAATVLVGRLEGEVEGEVEGRRPEVAARP